PTKARSSRKAALASCVGTNACSTYTSGGAHVLRLDGVVAGYGRTNVLQGLSLDAATGEIVAVLGRNGVGKSTLLKAIIGAVPVSSGTITLEGQRVERLPAHARARRGLAYVPQGREVFPGLSVLQNLRV